MKKISEDLEFLIWVIRYGVMLFLSNFELWLIIMTENFDKSIWPLDCDHMLEDCLFYFWDGLNDGVDGWIGVEGEDE